MTTTKERRASVELVGIARFWRFGGGNRTQTVDPLPSLATSPPDGLPADLKPRAEGRISKEELPQEKARRSVEVIGIARFWRSSVSVNKVASVDEELSPADLPASLQPHHHSSTPPPPPPPPPAPVTGHSARVLYALITGKIPPLSSRAPRWGSKKHPVPTTIPPAPLLLPKSGPADPKLNLSTSHAAASHRHVEARPVPFVSSKALKKLKSQLVKPVRPVSSALTSTLTPSAERSAQDRRRPQADGDPLRRRRGVFSRCGGATRLYRNRLQALSHYPSLRPC